jgi:hypothetical protein
MLWHIARDLIDQAVKETEQLNKWGIKYQSNSKWTDSLPTWDEILTNSINKMSTLSSTTLHQSWQHLMIGGNLQREARHIKAEAGLPLLAEVVGFSHCPMPGW